MSNLVPTAPESTGIMDLILRAGEQMDPAKISQLMDLNERMLNREAEKLFRADYVRMKPSLPRVVRTKDNTQTKSKYAPLEDINDTIDPILAEFGFGTSTKVVAQTPESITVRAELIHSGGHVESTDITMPLDNKGPQGTVNKTGPHATASSVTYAKRVAICALLNISTGDDKDGNTDSATIDIEQAATLDTLLRSTGADRPAFLKYFKVEDVRSLAAKDYQSAVTLLNKKVKKATAA